MLDIYIFGVRRVRILSFIIIFITVMAIYDYILLLICISDVETYNLWSHAPTELICSII